MSRVVAFEHHLLAEVALSLVIINVKHIEWGFMCRTNVESAASYEAEIRPKVFHAVPLIRMVLCVCMLRRIRMR